MYKFILLHSSKRGIVRLVAAVLTVFAVLFRSHFAAKGSSFEPEILKMILKFYKPHSDKVVIVYADYCFLGNYYSGQRTLFSNLSTKCFLTKSYKYRSQ